MPLLELSRIEKVFGHGASAVPAVRGIDLAVEPGSTIAIVGESGCGKTTLGRIVVGLEPASAGTIVFDGVDQELQARSTEYRRRVQMVFQHPAQSLNPRMRIGTMLAEPLRLLTTHPKAEIEARIADTLSLVGLDGDYAQRRPRALSGGQQQRVAIARALMSEPDLVVLDEPTSSLDQSVRGRIIALLRDIQQTRGVAYLFISHDLATVRRIADEVAVMYLGRVVERGPTEQLFERPMHPYTEALLSAAPVMDPDATRERIILAGETPNPSELPDGCSFQDRCPLVHDRCRTTQPRLADVGDGRLVECFAVQDGTTLSL